MITNLQLEDIIIEPFGPIFHGPGADKAEELFTLRKPTGAQLDAIERAKKYAMEQNIKTVLLKQSQQNESLQLNTARRNQTLALLNRIYIGSIAYDVKEDAIKQAFVPFGPVKNVSMSWDPTTLKHKGFAFVEFEYPESALLAIEQMNGTNFAGRLLKVGRPSNLPDATPFMNELIDEFKLQKRIYVGGVHSELTDSDIECVFRAFGNITMCRLIPDSQQSGSSHRGFGYVEFDNEESAIAAVVSMNRFDLGGQLLRVTKAISPPDGINTNPPVNHLPAATAVAAASVAARLLSMELDQIPETHSVKELDPVVRRHRSRTRSHSRVRSSRRQRHSRRRHSRRRRRSSTSVSRRRKSTTSSSSSTSRSSKKSSTSSRRRRRRSRYCRKDSRSPSRLREERKRKYRQKGSLRSGSSPRPAEVVDGRRSGNEPEKESDTVNLSTNTNSNWCTVSIEEEQTTTACAIRSNDSRLYNIPSPSSIPLPPTD
nr:poly(U) binding splicing factor PUF60 [Hymenolepis microstoma]